MVGPITLLICPISGPVSARIAPHVWAEALPFSPPSDGLYDPTQPPLGIVVPVATVLPVGGNQKLKGWI
jgi:hypothetical protein